MAAKVKRVREQFDRELALTNDIYQAAWKLAVYGGWKTALRALYYVAMRIGGERQRAEFAKFLSDVS